MPLQPFISRAALHGRMPAGSAPLPLVALAAILSGGACDRHDEARERRAGASALGYKEGDLLFGKFRLLEHLGSAPLGPGSPLRPSAEARGPRSEGGLGVVKEHREHAQAAPGALVEARQGGGGPLVSWPKGQEDLAKFDKPKPEHLGTGMYGEAWSVLEGSDKLVVKLLYAQKPGAGGKYEHVTAKTVKECVSKSGEKCGIVVAHMVQECRLLKELHSGESEYSQYVMQCYGLSVEVPEEKKTMVEIADWLVSQAEGDNPIYAKLEYCGTMNLEHAIQKSKVSLADVKVATKGVAGALQLLEERRIIHRDLKPDNVMMGDIKPMAIKVVDFGLALQVDDASWGSFVPESDAGTPGYLPPEVKCMDGPDEEQVDDALDEDQQDYFRSACQTYGDVQEFHFPVEHLHTELRAFPARAIDSFSLAVLIFSALTGGTLPSDYYKQAGLKFLKTDPKAHQFQGERLNYFDSKDLEDMLYYAKDDTKNKNKLKLLRKAFQELELLDGAYSDLLLVVLRGGLQGNSTQRPSALDVYQNALARAW